MAARLNPEHDARTREKIRTSQLINRLQSFVFGKCQMEKAQVTAALGLLKKTLPDLQATQTTLQNPDGSPILTGINVTFVKPEG